MFRPLIILATTICILLIVGLSVFQKVSEIGAYVSYRNSSLGEQLGPTSLLFINSCSQQEIDTDPKVIDVARSGYLNIVNKDSSAHEIEIAKTTFHKKLRPGEQWEIQGYKFSQSKDKWLIKCDGVDKGEASPKIMMYNDASGV